MEKEKSEIILKIDRIEAGVYQLVKPCGFRRYGRTLHRFVSGDISQVISTSLDSFALKLDLR